MPSFSSTHTRAQAQLDRGIAIEITSEGVRVPSRTGNAVYTVNAFGECDCAARGACWHVAYVELLIASHVPTFSYMPTAETVEWAHAVAARAVPVGDECPSLAPASEPVAILPRTGLPNPLYRVQVEERAARALELINELV